MFDILGRVITTTTVANKFSCQLDLSNLNKAMYFVQVSTNDGSVTKRIIKK
ncbi:MAG: T9SS type A sorting domain-containing protein [Flavobacteriaceae bacterium]|nr:T9SS type A sorting domain-containing protein [Flavobacteriaceae bacterium]